MRLGTPGVIVLLAVALVGCSPTVTVAPLPELGIPRDQVIATIEGAGFSCRLNDGDDPLYVCRDDSMPSDPLDAFISVELDSGLAIRDGQCLWAAEPPTVEDVPQLALPTLNAKAFSAIWVPTSTPGGDLSIEDLPREIRNASSPMRRMGEALGLNPISTAELCGLETPPIATG
jgi:hypothetical protein